MSISTPAIPQQLTQTGGAAPRPSSPPRPTSPRAAAFEDAVVAAFTRLVLADLMLRGYVEGHDLRQVCAALQHDARRHARGCAVELRAPDGGVYRSGDEARVRAHLLAATQGQR